MTNVFSLFSVVLPVEGIGSAETFLPRARQELQEYFAYKNLSAVFTEYVEPHFQHAVLSKTNSRSVQAVMRSMEDMAFALMILFNADNSHLYRFEVPVRNLTKALLKKQGLADALIEQQLAGIRDLELSSYEDEEMDVMDDMFMLNELKQLPPKRCEAYKMKVKKCISKEIPSCTFFYDFGDGWEFKLNLEDTEVQSPLRKPQALCGKGLGIIEDCGGVWGLGDIREAFAKKSGEAYENYKRWLGSSDIDLDAFDVKKVNQILKKEL